MFTSNYTNAMQIRQAFGLDGRDGTPGGWVEYSQKGNLVPWWTFRPADDYVGAMLNVPNLQTDPLIILHRDWGIATYILLIAPPKVNNYCLFGWVSNKKHSYAAGHVIENKYLMRMDQKNVTSRSAVAPLAAAYRASDGGDFVGLPDFNSAIPLLLESE